MTHSKNRRSRSRSSLGLTLAANVLATPATLTADNSTLPSIGGSGGLISGQQEADIGQQVMTSIRRSAPQIQDPLVYDYLSSMIYRLVPSAPLDDRRSEEHTSELQS